MNRLRQKQSQRQSKDWDSICTYLESESSWLSVRICHSCGFAKIFSHSNVIHKVTRFQSLKEVQKIVESIKELYEKSTTNGNKDEYCKLMQREIGLEVVYDEVKLLNSRTRKDYKIIIPAKK